MRLSRLVWRNVAGNAFRSGAVLLCAALVAGLVLTATFVERGPEAGLRDNHERLGADMLVLPWGTMTDKIGGVRLMSAAIDRWMPRATLARLAATEGVAQVSPSGTWPRSRARVLGAARGLPRGLRPGHRRGAPPLARRGAPRGRLRRGRSWWVRISACPDGEPLTLFGSDSRSPGA